MRINRFVAGATGLSRRKVDVLITAKRVTVNGQPALLGQEVSAADRIYLDRQQLHMAGPATTIILNKPPGYVVSRAAQGNKTIYALLPKKYALLKAVGRLDKASSGVLVLTDDGQLAHQLTHPRNQKQKIYEVKLRQPLSRRDELAIGRGIKLEDGVSRLQLMPLGKNRDSWQVRLHEGRNRQIRRTFQALNYQVIKLHRTHFGQYSLDNLASGQFREAPPLQQQHN